MTKRLINKLLFNEEVVLSVIHVSWWHYLMPLLRHGFLLFLAFFLLYPLQTFAFWGLVIFFLLMALALFGILRVIILRTQNIFIITDQRFIDIDQRSLFFREVSECDLAQIKDIRYNTKGIIATLGRLGTIALYYGDNNGHLEIPDVVDPLRVKERILQAQNYHNKKTIETQEEI
ncbi:MAG: hypothetical protein A2233_02445 [Candidatus Kerfeldbacteria bacterium RIFOXYA2_FULL_38_24]|uniref:DUF304 domain-containing protein n=1 Tax=Candidatus Kerfeldbacteria bacterium RIFOXYB2_FULL_38_14 TaxID=1798547 RepID=A0A1G2B9Z6_9BACT|nr:MAG: hypothetical protein A2233_02445 [Candidatus Kerfeldbacteria bacterium RIFOXYA2_FULL_38_24]OGY85845.1 MAG: hypothetical protein A2319_05825 [Candidatus Kerfeldbacteria bacterium RIFOXYB2_FULL_38_14]OGY89116.1 MAG: hypothetical protein A2458_02555 [Candidatus Kerfeldbacteria bacterium RIFOXYC2_FULL_38_9]